MIKKIILNAQTINEKSGRAKAIRSAGYIPAVIYGNGRENKSVKIKKLDFEKVFAAAGEFNLVDLIVDNEPALKAIIKDVQKEAVKNNIIHVDFYRVNMNKKITTEIPLNFIGESKAVKELGGTLVKNMDDVAVTCLPGDLVSQIDVDLNALESFEDMIRLKDLKLPGGMELESDTNEVVVMVSEVKEEAEARTGVAVAPAGDGGSEKVVSEETVKNK